MAGLRNPFGKRVTGTPTTTPPVPTGQGPTTGPLSGSGGSQGAGASGLRAAEQVSLVNYSPEEQMQQIDRTLSGVHFGMSLPHKFKETLAELWSVFGPMVLFAGTAGEVFFFIWNNVGGDSKGKPPAWWVALSVLATVIVLECTFMVLSYKCDTLRNQLKNKPGGATDDDKKEMASHRHFWFGLASGVGFGQVSFLVVSMQAHLDNMAFLIFFAIGRSVATLAADYYSAFIHKAKPTTGEVAAARLKERDLLTATLLKQSNERVKLMNDGILDLRTSTVEAEIKEDKLKTRLQIEREQNQNQISTLKTQQEQATIFTQLGNNMLRAIADPTMSDDDREKMFLLMKGFMEANKALPAPRITRIDEEV